VDPVKKTPTEPVDYAALSGAYAAAAVTVLAFARKRGDDDPLHPAEIVPLGIATFALSKLISKEKIDSWVREPFVDELPSGERRPKGRRMRYAVGELLTCTRCVGAWSSLALVGLRLGRPREGRIVTALLGTTAVNDWLHAGFTYVCAQGNAAQQQVDTVTRAAQEARFEHR
jgi:hypothetical protein